ncbi:sensor domain-containing phosphodiesterase [Lichenicoccus roseus]|uniref:EAL domain-containing protein n=1 Tax=Lichenicoccus roseus TaxID=2683649 RepID=A0A5R9J2P6_9PROT|nr:EAL domain-containing protein [Lichenicoccus roseus]TLU71905.1 EAL domain-containing protein [Lichenicoccus roseus]
MPAAALPHDEEIRLQSLQQSGLLNSQIDGRIKLLTRLAADVFKRPSAAVTLITAERQLNKAGVNIGSSSIPRENSFCSYAILQPNEPLVVEDATRDARFSDNPLVTAEKGPLRFYAGMPLRLPDGQPVGALSVLDHVPGSMSTNEIQTLRAMALQVEDIIRRHRVSSGQRRELLSELRKDMRAGGLFLHWQPIAVAPTLRIVGHEALVRWTRRDGSVLMPDSFIPAAAGSALITDIDRYVLTAACAEVAQANDCGSIAVNISGRWFGAGSRRIAGEVEEVCARTGLDPRRLTIELTEDVPIRDPHRALGELRELKTLGVKLALDDFGTAYSSLNYVEKFPFDVIKLDRAFVRAVGISSRAEVVIQSVVRLAHQLGMMTCAEGVETESQLTFLQSEGADLVQGYFVGRPGARS